MGIIKKSEADKAIVTTTEVVNEEKLEKKIVFNKEDLPSSDSSSSEETTIEAPTDAPVEKHKKKGGRPRKSDKK